MLLLCWRGKLLEKGQMFALQISSTVSSGQLGSYLRVGMRMGMRKLTEENSRFWDQVCFYPLQNKTNKTPKTKTTTTNQEQNKIKKNQTNRGNYVGN